MASQIDMFYMDDELTYIVTPPPTPFLYHTPTSGFSTQAGDRRMTTPYFNIKSRVALDGGPFEEAYIRLQFSSTEAAEERHDPNNRDPLSTTSIPL